MMHAITQRIFPLLDPAKQGTRPESRVRFAAQRTRAPDTGQLPCCFLFSKEKKMGLTEGAFSWKRGCRVELCRIARDALGLLRFAEGQILEREIAVW